MRRFGPEDGWRRVVAVAAAVVVATMAASAFWMTVWALGADPADRDRDPLSDLFVTYLPRFLAIGALLTAVGEFYRGEVRSLEAMRAAEADRTVLEQQTLQARLRTLEAQIEPHFLFNTLANVRRLYETDHATGEAMLERLMRYLQVALPSMRADRSTLEREGHLINAYLQLQQVRMGRRLEFDIDIAPALQQVEVPPMMPLTLVENAIKSAAARRGPGRGRRALEGDRIRLEVADTGRGFGGDTAGGGTASQSGRVLRRCSAPRANSRSLRASRAACWRRSASRSSCGRSPHERRADAGRRLAFGGWGRDRFRAYGRATPAPEEPGGRAGRAGAGGVLFGRLHADLRRANGDDRGAAGIDHPHRGIDPAGHHRRRRGCGSGRAAGAELYRRRVRRCGDRGFLAGRCAKPWPALRVPVPGAGSRRRRLRPYHRLDQFLVGILLGGLATFVHVNRRTALAARRRQHEAERFAPAPSGARSNRSCRPCRRGSSRCSCSRPWTASTRCTAATSARPAGCSRT
jgi:hypothetical protein